ncbi:DUF1189 domain-containing protein [Pseudoneobacillus sp. C159]
MNIFKQFLLSLYSPHSVAKFRFQGIGKTILYVFLLTLLSILPTSYYFVTDINKGIDFISETLANDIPAFTIENGQLSLESTKPVIIEKDDFKIILDDTGSIDPNEFSKQENVLALLKNDFLLYAGGQGQTNSYAAFQGMKMTSQDVVDFIEKSKGLKAIFIPIMIIIIYIFSSGAKFIEVSVLALIGMLLASTFKRHLQYRHTWRIAAYCVTLSTLFFTVMALLKTTVPNGFLINWTVSIIMLILAIKEIPMKKQKLE